MSECQNAPINRVITHGTAPTGFRNGLSARAGRAPVIKRHQTKGRKRISGLRDGEPLRLIPDADCRCPAPVMNPTFKGTARFTKAVRLRHRQDFLRAQAQGKRLSTRHFGVVLAPMAEGHPRLGLVATRRLGKAVQRNRVNRGLGEFYRRHQTELPAFDLVIMAKKGAAGFGIS